MIKIKPKISITGILAVFFISFIYFALRLQNLTAIPVFGDEAIYLRWSQVIRSVDTLRFLPLTDGKQPLFMWLTIPFYKFISDPLFAGRLLSIISGYVNLIFITISSAILLNYSSPASQPINFILHSLKKNRLILILTSLVYIFSVYPFFFDRLSLPDNLLSTFVSLSLLTLLLLAKFPRLDLSIILGFSLGLAWLTKSPAIYFLSLSLFWLLISSLRQKKYLFYATATAFLSYLTYNILRLGPQFHQIALRNQDYVWKLSDVIKHPFDPFRSHLIAVFKIWSVYLNWLIIILPILALIILIIRRPPKLSNPILHPLFIVTLWFIAPLVATLTFAKVFTARYVLFSLPPLFILFTLSLNYIFQIFPKKIIIPLLLIFQIPSLLFIYRLSFQPQNLILPPTESGYLQDWTSGWGIQKAADYLIGRSQQANVIVGTEGYFGTLPDGLQIYTNQIPQLTIFGVGLEFTQIPEKLIDALNSGDEVYLLINQSRNRLLPDQIAKLTTIAQYPKPNNDFLILYQLTTP